MFSFYFIRYWKIIFVGVHSQKLGHSLYDKYPFLWPTIKGHSLPKYLGYLNQGYFRIFEAKWLCINLGPVKGKQYVRSCNHLDWNMSRSLRVLAPDVHHLYLAEWLLNSDLLGYLECYWSPRQWGTCWYTILSAICFKVLDELENLTRLNLLLHLAWTIFH